MKSFFYKSLMTEGFKTIYFQPLKLWRLLDFTILRTDTSSSKTKTEGLDFLCKNIFIKANFEEFLKSRFACM